jgi:hypothetical protein
VRSSHTPCTTLSGDSSSPPQWKHKFNIIVHYFSLLSSMLIVVRMKILGSVIVSSSTFGEKKATST